MTDLPWSDEFTAYSPDLSKWAPINKRYPTNGQAFYSPANAYLAGSCLRIVTKNELAPDGLSQFTTARLESIPTFKPPVRIAALVKAPWTFGIGSAFWTEGVVLIPPLPWPTFGEIDIAEFPATLTNSVYSCHLHGPMPTAPASDNGVQVVNPKLPQVYTAGFHEYAVDWRPDSITWLLDGVVVGSITAARYEAVGGDWLPFSGAWPHKLILNGQVGGLGDKWMGSPTPQSAWPQTLLVDYVRVSAL